MNEYEIKWGNNYEILKTLPDNFVDCCVTSPSYYNLRDYHAGEKEIGHENTPEEYVVKLRDVFHEVKRVLKPTGTLWLNLGDSYDKNKNLIGIPWRVAFALKDDGWTLRSDIVWAKPNALPQSVKDRCSSSHEYIFMFSKQPSGYYFDYEAIEEPANFDPSKKNDISQKDEPCLFPDYLSTSAEAGTVHIKFGGTKYPNAESGADATYSGKEWKPKVRVRQTTEDRTKDSGQKLNPMRNRHIDFCVLRRKRDVWSIPTQGYDGAHFATFPEKLVEPCILAGCPKNGIVLDCFNGAGTTGVVALKNHRRYLGIELNEEYIKLSRERIERETAQQTFAF